MPVDPWLPLSLFISQHPGKDAGDGVWAVSSKMIPYLEKGELLSYSWEWLNSLGQSELS